MIEQLPWTKSRKNSPQKTTLNAKNDSHINDDKILFDDILDHKVITKKDIQIHGRLDKG